MADDLNVVSMESDEPDEILQAVERVKLQLLPKKSRNQYDIAYNRFLQWCKVKKVVNNYTENVMLAYFEEKAKIWASSTLWANYSMIKLCLNVNKNQDISKYHKLIAFLKRMSEGYQPKKSKILTKEQIDTFIDTAPDDSYLMIKVVLIMGVFGACRREELCQMTLDNIQDLGTSLMVTIPNTKTNVPRTFTVVGKYMEFYHRYLALRPAKIPHKRLFIKYNKQKCFTQPVGINTFGKIPSVVAKFLELPDSTLYSGHCFRRTSASLLADSGADFSTIKRHGGWKSSSVAEGYVENSIENKKTIASQILPTLSTEPIINHITTNSIPTSSTHGITISNCNNCTISISILPKD